MKLCCIYYFEISTSRNAPEFARLAYFGQHAQTTTTLITSKRGVVDPEIAKHVKLCRCPIEIGFLKDDAFYLCNFAIFMVYATLKVAWLRLTRQVDVLYTIQTPDSMIAWFFKAATRVRWMVDILDLPYLYAADLAERKHVKRFFFPSIRNLILSIMKKIIRHADVVGTTSFGINEGFAKALVNEFNVPPEKIFMVSNGVNLDLTKPQNIAQRTDCFNVFYVGLVSRMRGLDTLTQAVAELAKDIPNIRLTLVGPVKEGDEAWLAEQGKELGITERIDFRGTLPHHEVLPLIEQAQVCVNPSPRRKEHDGNHRIKIFEYLAMGRAVVVTNLAGASRIITDRENGLLVEPDDPADMAGAILELAQDDKLRHKLEHNARPSIEQFDLKKIAGSIHGKLEELTGKEDGSGNPASSSSDTSCATPPKH